MCGYLFSYCKDAAYLQGKHDHLRRAATFFSRRGPDVLKVSSGYKYFSVHARLRIEQDGSVDQPYKDGSLSLCYNGEIYNKRELVEKYLGAGCDGISDVQLLTKLYRMYPENFYEYLNGIFSFVLYDSKKGTALIIRDRMGAKPLYYSFKNGTLHASTTLHAVVWASNLANVNANALLSTIRFRGVLNDESLYNDVHQLQPGGVLRLANDELDVSLMRGDWQGSSSSDLRQCLETAVLQQIPEGVRFSCFLSGGVDSSILVNILSNRDSKLEPLVFRTTGEFDESQIAAGFCKSLDIVPKFVEFDSTNYYEDLVRSTLRFEQPIIMHNELEMARLSSIAAGSGIKVVMCGEGADELFHGYGRIFRSTHNIMHRAIQYLSSAFNSRIASMQLRKMFLDRYAYCSWPALSKVVKPEFLHCYREWEEQALVSHWDNQAKAIDNIDRFFTGHHLESLLAMVDRTTAYYGIEGRVPYVDLNIVHLANAIPPGEKIRWRSSIARSLALFMDPALYSERLDIPKYPLKNAFRDALPSAVANARKNGFAVNLVEKMEEPGRMTKVRDDLVAGRGRVSMYFDGEGLRELFAKNTKAAWVITNMEIYFRTHEERLGIVY